MVSHNIVDAEAAQAAASTTKRKRYDAETVEKATKINEEEDGEFVCLTF